MLAGWWTRVLALVVVVVDVDFFSLVASGEKVREGLRRLVGWQEKESGSTRRTRRLKIEAQRRLGLKIAGDALRTPETRTHGLKPKRRRMTTTRTRLWTN